MNANIDRRTLLRIGLSAAAGTFALGGAFASASEARPITAGCVPNDGATPPQTAGPFYPGESAFQPDADLTLAPGQKAAPLGQVVYINGRVHDQSCRPIAGATVEIWQACASGRYNNPNDPNPAALDPNFKYWGEAITDAEGIYAFKTIKPGAYPADENWIRPPHIHFKITKLGYHELVTQMYFKGDPLNARDLILDKVPHDQWGRVIVDFQPRSTPLAPDAIAGEFNIALTSVR